jgi:hypothetical protein
MKVVVRRLALLLLTALMLGAPGTAVLATENESFGLTPDPENKDGKVRFGFEIPLEPGATFEDAVRVYNRTDQTLNIALYAADAEASTDDAVSDVSVGFRSSRPKGVGSWIDLAREDIRLDAHDQVIVTFRVHVKSAAPNPNLGAIVAENTGTNGVRSRDSQRLSLRVRTGPPNSQTTSVRARPLLLRSPWIVVAMLGLVVFIVLVWVGARRARRPKDVVVATGEIESADALADAPEASIPVIKRLGETESVLDRPLLDDALLVEVDPDDIDEFELSGEIVDEDEDDEEEDEEYDDDLEDEDEDDEDEEDELPPARPRPASRKPKAKAPAKKKAPAKRSARATTAKRSSAAKSKRKTSAPKRKPARPVAKKRSQPRKPAPAKPKPAQNFIPLDDL